MDIGEILAFQEESRHGCGGDYSRPGSNVADLVHFTNVTEVHSSARAKVQGNMQYKNDHILMSEGLSDEFSLDLTSVDRVKKILEEANK